MTATLSEYHQKAYSGLPEETVLGFMRQANNVDPDHMTFEAMRLYAIRNNIKEEIFWAIMGEGDDELL